MSVRTKTSNFRCAFNVDERRRERERANEREIRFDVSHISIFVYTHTHATNVRADTATPLLQQHNLIQIYTR